jgi:hypothetical protein
VAAPVRLEGRLKRALDEALFGVPARASISIQCPRRDEMLVFTQASSPESRALSVQVVTEDFRMLEDGFWCLHANGMERVCVGDDASQTVLTLEPVIGNMSTVHNSVHIRLEAVLRGGDLAGPAVQKRSAPVHVRALF